MNIMTKRGQLDNIVTYEHICDTYADMANIPSNQINLGSVCIVIQDQNDTLGVYIANSSKEWEPLLVQNNSDNDNLPIQICDNNSYDSQTGLPTVELPLENTIYLVPNTTNNTTNLFSEYIYVNDEWEQLGTITLNINDYFQNASVASTFSSSTEYFIDDYVIYNGILYKFLENHTGAWDANDVEAVLLTDILDKDADKLNYLMGVLAAESFILPIIPNISGYIHTDQDYVALIDDNEPFSLENIDIGHTGGTTMIYTIVECKPGDSFYVKGRTRALRANWLTFIDNTGRIISRGGRYKNYTVIEAPEDAAYLICQCTIGTVSSTFYNKIITLQDKLNYIENLNESIASVENNATSSKSYNKGDFIIKNNKLYKAKSNLSTSSVLNDSTLELTTVAAELKNILARLALLEE